MARGLSPESSGRKVFTIFLVYCIVSSFYDASMLSPTLRDIFPTPMARYSLFVLKVPLNPNKPNQTKPSRGDGNKRCCASIP